MLIPALGVIMLVRISFIFSLTALVLVLMFGLDSQMFRFPLWLTRKNGECGCRLINSKNGSIIEVPVGYQCKDKVVAPLTPEYSLQQYRTGKTLGKHY